MRSASIAFAGPLLICLSAASARHVIAEQTLPYIAYVEDKSAVVRSGPGTEFYATDSLPWATKVEVHRHEDAEWAAIRPPSSSFSWIPAIAVTISEKRDLGIVESTTKTMIGSHLNDRVDVDFVTLRAGDVVEILGEAELDLGSDKVLQRCYKILPPAGEFRWIRRSQLAVQPPTRPAGQDDVTPMADDSGPGIALVQFEATESREQEEVPLELLEPPELPTRDTEPLPPVSAEANSDRSYAAGAPDNPIQLGPPVGALESGPTGAPPQFGLPAPGEYVPPPGGYAALPSEARPARRMPLGPTSRMRLGQELTIIEMELTQQVAQPPETWELSDLRVRAQAVIDTSDQAEHRATAQRIIAKVAQLTDVKRRHQGLLQEQDRLARRTLANNRYADQSSGASPSTVTSNEYLAAAPSNYDGVGWLMPVVTDHPSIPRYVLTDAEGNIQQFVSPKPGMNLSRFEQKRIAIYGQRGYLPTYDQRHLMAERIITLDKVR